MSKSFSSLSLQRLISYSLEVNVIIVAACVPTIRPLFSLFISTLQSSYRSKKTHSKLHSSHANNPEAHKLSTRVVAGESTPNDIWDRHGSESDMLPYNRIREVIELEVRYEQRNHGLRRDVEEAVDTPESTIYTKNMV